MKIIRKNVIKGSDAVYVVTRHGRRVEDVNYKAKHEAEYRAFQLQEMVKQYDHTSVGKVDIVYTSRPHKIY
jgi:hypothetical protein